MDTIHRAPTTYDLYKVDVIPEFTMSSNTRLKILFFRLRSSFNVYYHVPLCMVQQVILFSRYILILFRPFGLVATSLLIKSSIPDYAMDFFPQVRIIPQYVKTEYYGAVVTRFKTYRFELKLQEAVLMRSQMR